MLRARMLRAYLLRLPANGCTAEDILDGTGVSWQQIDRLIELDVWTYATILDRIACFTSPEFAAACGATLRAQELGAVGFAVMSSARISDAIDVWCRYAGITDYPLGGTLRITDQHWEYSFFPRVPMTYQALRFSIESAIGSFRSLSVELCRREPDILQLDFPYPRPQGLSPCEQLNVKRMKFDAPFFMMTGPTQDLDNRMLSADREIFDRCVAACASALLARQRTTSTSDQVIELVTASTGVLPRIEDIAAKLALSKRTLQRKLSEEGSNFGALVRDFRSRYAPLLFESEAFNAKQAAFRLCYRDVSSVYRLQNVRTSE